ncbi:hypothetical protein LPJ53_001235 [Coemansia erecta]|uniref:Uncharacterized protein n=1 Tax=Coemansia erecta TaxID=147472 RepID=A0A9W7Y6X9_9FUNG|nr:hypothetical protein LPJ53_001235 [Coemansia erecta]
MTLQQPSAPQVCRIAADLGASEAQILATAPLRRPGSGAGKRLGGGRMLKTALTALWQRAPVLFGVRSEAGLGGHVRALESRLLQADEAGSERAMVWLSWDECRQLAQVFRRLEYVDESGKPTALVDAYVSRLTDGESQTSDSAGEADSEQAAAWRLISREFARATALGISGEAEEVAAGQAVAVAVVTWFPRLEYLELQRVPWEALRHWGAWAGQRLSCLKVQYAGLDVIGMLAADGDDAAWKRLRLLDLAGSSGVDVAALTGKLGGRLGGVTRLSLAACDLEEVPAGVHRLAGLAWLDLSSNAITDVTDAWLRLGGVSRLSLAHNALTDVAGLGRLWALETLDLSCNQLAQWQALLALRNLPLLRDLQVEGNPLVQQEEHRAQLFAAFDHRDTALVLDGRAPTALERRKMAAIPRVATGRTDYAAGDAVRRPKVAVIEEAEIEAEDEAEPKDAAENGAAQMPGLPSLSRAATLAAMGRAPHVLRAAGLQAVSLAASHRRGNADHATARRSVPLRRRATATAGAMAMAQQKAGDAQLHGYSVPASFSSRPASRARSPSERSARMGGSEARDPERFRRRVEMMRAEAGESWLRAFAELQAAEESGTASPEPALSRPASRAEHESLVSLSPRPDHTELAAEAEPVEPAADDTQLPSFLFPRRRNAAAAARKREIARLPHYSAESVAAVVGVDGSANAAANADAGENADADATSGDAGEGETSAGADDEADAADDSSEASPAPATALQRMLNEGSANGAARVVAEDACVVRYRLAQADGSGAMLERSATSGLTLVVTAAGDLVEIDEARDCEVGRTSLAAVVRVAAGGSGKEAHAGWVVAEVKRDRLDTPQWVALASPAASLSHLLQSAGGGERRAAQVFKQAECLRCGWRGCVDPAHAVLALLAERLPEEGRSPLPPAAAAAPLAASCARCGRSYLREFYAPTEGESGEDAGDGPKTDAWRQALRPRQRHRGGAATGKQTTAAAANDADESGRRAQHVQQARLAADADEQALRGAGSAVAGLLPFADASNAVRLFLQLSVFTHDNERLLRWVPVGLVRQAPPLVAAPARERSASSAASKAAAAGKWGLASFLGSSSPALPEPAATAESVTGAVAATPPPPPPALAEQAAFVALSSHALYVFSPTRDALAREVAVDDARRAAVELQPERYLALLFALPLGALGRIDVGPNRQYLALHASLLRTAAGGSQWSDDAPMHRLLQSPDPSYAEAGFGEGPATTVAGDVAPSTSSSSTAAAAVSSCVLMVRDRLACSDLLDALVEIGYETRVLDSGGGVGSGRLRAINHDVEWAMHHLVQQVFLRPTTFDALDADSHADSASEKLAALRALHDELLRSPSARSPGALVDAASSDATIVDKVTYEFVRLYVCCGQAQQAAARGMRPLTLVATPGFVYLARERTDVWPPPVPDMHVVYQRWQRVAPPTIVTSDPDTYDPEVLQRELARRSNGTSVASANSRASSASAAAVAEVDVLPAAAAVAARDASSDALLARLAASAVPQYDCVMAARPVGDLRRVTVVVRPLAVVPLLAAGGEGPAEARMGCAGSSWHAMLRVEFATAAGDNDSGNGNGAGDGGEIEEMRRTGWNVWFASVASAREAADALVALAKAAGVAGVEMVEA